MKFNINGMDHLHQQMEKLIRAVNNLTDAVRAGQQSNEETEEALMATMDELKAEVGRNTDATGSVVALVNGLADQLEAAVANNDPAAVQEVIDQMRSNTDALAGAVHENTPHPDQTLPGDL